MAAITNIEKVKNLLDIGKYLVMSRIDFNGLRLYIQDTPFAYYSGLTGALAACTFKGDPDARRIVKWRESMIENLGKDNADASLSLMGDFGTLTHTALVTIKNKGFINWNEEKDLAFGFFTQAYQHKGLTPDLRTINKMVYEYQKHVASLMQFVYEMVDQIWAIETPAKWDDLKIATPIDIFCNCRQTPKGEFKPTTVNIKTSSQISAHQFEQVACELDMWNQTYNSSVGYTAILRTKDWNESKVPTYEYKSLALADAKTYYEDAKQRLGLCLNSAASYYPNPVNMSFTGKTKIGEQPVIISKTIEEEWIDALQQKTEVI